MASYDYRDYKQHVFTEEGSRQFLRIRDRVKSLLHNAGCFNMESAIRGEVGMSWNMMACVDRLVELGEIVEIKQERTSAGRHRIFTGK